MQVPPLQFGQMIRVQADTPELADSFAREISAAKTKERPSMMSSQRVFPDMPNDVFLFTAIHWREAHAAWNEHRGAFFRTMLGRDDVVPEPDADAAKAEEVDMEVALYTKQRQMVEDALALAETDPDNPDAMITFDVRDSKLAEETVLPEALRVSGADTAEDIGQAQQKLARARNHLYREFDVDPRTVTGFTPNHDPSSSYLFWGDTRLRFDDLSRKFEAEPTENNAFETVFEWFIDGLRQIGVLQDVSLEEALNTTEDGTEA